jgi:hypothetical protein
MKTIKYFDKNWKETTADKAKYAVLMEFKKDGTIKSSETFMVAK